LVNWKFEWQQKDAAWHFIWYIRQTLIYNLIIRMFNEYIFTVICKIIL
jgi:hypothetical protein